MKKVFVLIMFSLFIVTGNVGAFDFDCQWEGYMDCSNDLPDATPIYFKVEITKKGNLFTTLNITPTPGEKCSGVLDGNKISIACDDGSFGNGEIKGKTIYIISHKPSHAATCEVKGTLID